MGDILFQALLWDIFGGLMALGFIVVRTLVIEPMQDWRDRRRYRAGRPNR